MYRGAAVEDSSFYSGFNGEGNGNQQTMTSQLSCGMLVRALLPQLEKDRAMLIQTFYSQLQKNEISKDDLLWYMRLVTGDEMMQSTLRKLQTQAANNSHTATNQSQLYPQPSGWQLQGPSGKSLEVGRHADSHRAQVGQMSTSIAGTLLHEGKYLEFPDHRLKKQQYIQFSQQRSQLSHLPSAPSKPDNTASGSVKDRSFMIQFSRAGLTPPTTLVPASSVSTPSPSLLGTTIQSSAQMPSLRADAGRRNNSKALPKKPLAGQKKPVKACKKQKVSGSFDDRSIDKLNDVTALSGINLKEEEEQLCSISKKDSHVSEASRRIVQEEEERMILQLIPLQKLILEKMARYGLKNMSDDVQRCLSLSVEERMRGFISNAIRLSKQRVDAEKARHKTVMTSDIRQQVMDINSKAHEALDLVKLQPGSSVGVNADTEKDEGRGKSIKVNKEEDNSKMRAANVAVRAATGVGDIASRWQSMVEAKQNKGGSDTSSDPQTNKDAGQKPSMPVSMRKVGRNQAVVPRSISVKDVVAALEREPQMSKSTLLYRLHLRID